MGLSGPVPRRVDAATKAGLLRLIDEATSAGWPHRRVCEYLQLAEGRAWRWYERREAGRLEDDRSGAGAVHRLLALERDAIIALFDRWGEIDRSHRKLAHRGSYEGLVWVSPATVRRVLAAKRPGSAPPKASGTVRAPPVPRVGDLRAQLDLDLRHDAFQALPRDRGDHDHGPRHTQVDLRDRLGRRDQHPGPGRVQRRPGARGPARPRCPPGRPRRSLPH